jgi:hypothetical protein
MAEKDRLIDAILELELKMFLAVRARYPVSCQQHPETFRLHRGAQFSVWSEEALRSYRDDLLKAEQQGRNLMTLKYARMENLIPPLSQNPLIDKIVDLEQEAQEEVSSRYPNFLSRGRPIEDDRSGTTSFKTYLRGELETYSDRTLELLHRDIQQMKAQGKNWAEQAYTNLVRSIGYDSLADLEESLRKKDASPVDPGAVRHN